MDPKTGMAFILEKTITETFLTRARTSPDFVAFQYRPLDNTGWESLTYRSFHESCRILSFGLMGLEVKPGDRVAILSKTRIEWSLCDMAILGAKAITVPIYPSNTPSEVIYILNHVEAAVAIVEDGTQLEKVLQARAKDPACLPCLRKIIVIEPSAIKLAVNPQRNIQDVLTLQALRELGRREEGRNPTRFDDNLASARPSDLLTICYTTGTTGIPKGVPITHDNMMSVMEDAIDRAGSRLHPCEEVILSFLPFSHVLGKLESMIIHVIGAREVFCTDLDQLPQLMAEVKPTVLFGVPRIFEKAHSRILGSIRGSPPRRRQLFQKALEIGREFHSRACAKQRPSLKLRIEHSLARTLVLNRIADGFGGRLRFAISGGAALSPEVGEFFQACGIPILEGYGLTETTAPITLNDFDCPRFGTVGKPLRDVTLKIAEDGEILVKSRKVFQGYYRSPDETALALRDGWFHTGDIGLIDDQGDLHITDRKKDLIVTSGGKKIAPQKIEQIAKTQPPINEIVVHGDRRNFLTALVTLHRDQVIQYANEHDILFSEYPELIKNPRVLAWVEKAVEAVNQQLASYETIKKFIILPNDFTIEGGELTASLKVRRNVVEKRYREQLDGLYAE